MSKASELAAQLMTQRVATVEALKGIASESLNRKNQDGRTMRAMVRVMQDHEMSHTVHIQKTRQTLGAMPTEVQMVLAQALGARAALASAMIGLSDEDLYRRPTADEWSIGEVAEHMLKYDPILIERIRTQFGEV